MIGCCALAGAMSTDALEIRMSSRIRAPSVALAAALTGGVVAQAVASTSSFEEEVKAGVEEIYVFRTTRTAQERGATPACASAPFPTASEDHYALWSINLRASDSRLVNTHRKAVGEFRACLSRLAQGEPLNMYATGTLAHIPWVGVGECLVTKSQPPVRTVLALNCQLNLSGLPEAYAGGILTSSTVAPLVGRERGAAAHVPGYLSTSVVTVRLWRASVFTRAARRPVPTTG
jgi:hypothetical protein